MNGHHSATNGKPTNSPFTRQPLKIVVAGAGIGGLFAAIALRAEGHEVDVYESSRFAVETGAAIHVPPNVNGLLRKYGLYPEKHGAVTCESISEGYPNGDLKFRNDLRGLGHAFPYPWQLIHRIELHDALKDIARDPQRAGKPVAIHLTSRVVSVDVERTSIQLEDGTIVFGDLVIGADGVHSVVRKYVVERDEKASPSGTSAFRFLIPHADIKADPVTVHFVERTGELTMINGDERRMVMYPCRNNTELNFVALHPSRESSGTSEDWNAAGSKDMLLKAFDMFSSDLQALLMKTDKDSVKVWQLLDMEALPNWTKGRVALLGDAAHPFLPHQGQGGAQAMEDAAALAALMPLGTQVADIPSRFKLYTEARYERATMIQRYSRDSGNLVKGSKHGAKELMDPMKFTGINFDHHAYNHARALLKRDQIQKAAYQRMPLSFGPSPGPRQDLDGNKREMMTDAKYTTAYMTFKTPKSYLQTLMPMGNFKIDAEGGWTTATFSVTKLENLAWLGGRGYTHFGLYVHNAVATDASASESNGAEKKEVRGDFLPVLFENMADPIITGREELSFSKVFATLQEERWGNAYSLNAGWEGTTFCKLHLSDLVAESDEEAPVQAPTLSHKVVLSSKKVSESYTGIDLKIGNGLKEKRWKAGTANISFTDFKGGELRLAFPTLANIIEGLRDIEVSQVLASGIRKSS